MGVLKIWHMNPEIVEHQGMLQHVQTLLGQDSDPQVMANCLTLLMQVSPQWLEQFLRIECAAGPFQQDKLQPAAASLTLYTVKM